MSFAIVSLILLAVVALLAIPVIAAVVGRGMSDDDPNETGDPGEDRNVEPKREEEREESRGHERS